MSEEAILRRLKTADRLRDLCLSLMKAKKESDEKAEEIKLANEKATPKKMKINDDEVSV